MSLNRVFLIGHLGRDPELRYTTKSFPVARATLATSVDAGGRCFTEWHQLKAFGRLAEVLAEYCTNGQHLHIEGHLHYSQWTTDDGKHHRLAEVIIDHLLFLDRAQQRDTMPVSGASVPDSDADPFIPE